MVFNLPPTFVVVGLFGMPFGIRADLCEYLSVRVLRFSFLASLWNYQDAFLSFLVLVLLCFCSFLLVVVGF
jgi:hypothetical protein